MKGCQGETKREPTGFCASPDSSTGLNRRISRNFASYGKRVGGVKIGFRIGYFVAFLPIDS